MKKPIEEVLRPWAGVAVFSDGSAKLISNHGNFKAAERACKTEISRLNRGISKLPEVPVKFEIWLAKWKCWTAFKVEAEKGK